MSILGKDQYASASKAVQRAYVASGTKQYQEARDELEAAVEAIHVWRDALAEALYAQEIEARLGKMATSTKGGGV